MSRMFTIAVREYLAFVRTVGFWLSICLMPAGLLTAIYATSMTAKVAPPPNVAVVDMTGGGYVAPLADGAAQPHRPDLAARGHRRRARRALSRAPRRLRRHCAPTSPARSARPPARASTTR